MSYDVDEFVNSNRFNVQFDEVELGHDEEKAFDLFQNIVKWNVDSMRDNSNDDAYPVIVLERNNKPIAWYDLEMFCGFAKVN
jgi:hypothetical protein